MKGQSTKLKVKHIQQQKILQHNITCDERTYENTKNRNI